LILLFILEEIGVTVAERVDDNRGSGCLIAVPEPNPGGMHGSLALHGTGVRRVFYRIS
jgi:hypothetical protein